MPVQPGGCAGHGQQPEGDNSDSCCRTVCCIHDSCHARSQRACEGAALDICKALSLHAAQGSVKSSQETARVLLIYSYPRACAGINHKDKRHKGNSISGVLATPVHDQGCFTKTDAKATQIFRKHPTEDVVSANFVLQILSSCSDAMVLPMLLCCSIQQF